MGKISVIIADSNKSPLDRLEGILKSDVDLDILGRTMYGDELLKLIKEKKPDIVILDVILMKLDGLEVMARVKKGNEYDKKPTFIVLTSNTTDCVMEMAINSGARFYIAKPYDGNLLLSRIHQIM